MLRPLFAAALLLTAAGCDSTGPAPEVPPTEATAPLRPVAERAAFDETGGAPFGIALTADGGLNATSTDPAPFPSYISGLWLGTGDETAADVTVTWAGSVPRSNLGTTCGSDLFALDADTTYTETEAWPRDLGAPVTADGAPRVYGDRMLWGAFCPAAVEDYLPQLQSPVDDLRMTVAAYAYDRADLAGVRFARYEITNTGSGTVQDLRTGHYADTDLSPTADAVGFDAPSGLSYVYSLATDAAGAYRVPTVSGFAFLETPEAAPLLAHRIVRKNSYVNPEFGELGFDTPVPFLHALDGLSNDGDPMVDPTTGGASMFAFTGDPFAGTGWRDGLLEDGSYGGGDARHMTSVAPVTLAPGETVVVTVVWVTATDATPQASHAEVLRTLAAVRAEPALWQF